MKGILLRVTMVVLLLAVAASSLEAQRRTRRRPAAASAGPRYGAHLGYNFDVEELLLGAQLSWPMAPTIDLYPTFDYYFVSGGSLWGLNVDVKYRPPTRYGVWYAGGGLNLTHVGGGGASDTQTNLNLLTGLEGRRGRSRPYVEARFILGNGSMFQLVGGVSWR